MGALFTKLSDKNTRGFGLSKGLLNEEKKHKAFHFTLEVMAAWWIAFKMGKGKDVSFYISDYLETQLDSIIEQKYLYCLMWCEDFVNEIDVDFIAPSEDTNEEYAHLLSKGLYSTEELPLVVKSNPKEWARNYAERIIAEDVAVEFLNPGSIDYYYASDILDLEIYQLVQYRWSLSYILLGKLDLRTGKNVEAALCPEDEQFSCDSIEGKTEQEQCMWGLCKEIRYFSKLMDFMKDQILIFRTIPEYPVPPHVDKRRMKFRGKILSVPMTPPVFVDHINPYRVCYFAIALGVPLSLEMTGALICGRVLSSPFPNPPEGITARRDTS